MLLLSPIWLLYKLCRIKNHCNLTNWILLDKYIIYLEKSLHNLKQVLNLSCSNYVSGLSCRSNENVFRIPRKTRLRFLSLSSFDQRLYWLQHTVPYNMNLSTHSVTYILKTFCEFLSWSLWRSNTFTKSVKKVKNWRSCYDNLNEYLVFQQKMRKSEKWKRSVCSSTQDF